MNWLKRWAHELREDAHAVYLAARDPRVPWYAKLLAIAITGYVLSPIDLIPDFVPVLGLIDDLLLVPLGIWITLRLIPRGLVAEHRAAAARLEYKPVSKRGALLVLAVWAVVFASIGLSVWSYRYW